MIKYGPEEGQEAYHGKTFLGVLDGDVLRDILAEACPEEWQSYFCGVHADKVLSIMQEQGYILVRGSGQTITEAIDHVLNEI